MTVALVPFAASAALVAAGVTLLLERSLVRLLVGVILLGNGVNLLILVAGGPAGRPPILGHAAPSQMADPLPQAMVLTSVVITLGVTAFLLAVVHRSWQLTGGDEVQDDTEDRRVRLRARRGELARSVLAHREAYRRLVRRQRAELAALRATRQAEEASRRGRHGESGALREEFARREREQAERERVIRGRLRDRRRQARREMRAAIRADRERQARAEDPELGGDD